jgi:hypothetical protein
MKLSDRFLAVFAGYPNAYGTHGELKKKSSGNKLDQKGSSKTVRAKVTNKLWDAHLDGKVGLGIIPIREDGTCTWGCIDIDIYENFNPGALAQKIATLKIPMIVCRSKSGGAHVFVFFNRPSPADRVQEKLREIAASLGYGNSEIFPKQTHFLSERGDLGSWLNMPYFGGADTTRYAFNGEGKSISPDKFLEMAVNGTVEIDEFEKVDLPVISDKIFKKGPPCLQYLTEQGFPEGTRNGGLFNLGVFAKKAHPESWEAEMNTYNQRFLNPPLGGAEVQGIVAQLKKKTYFYTCTDQPICTFCNSAVCKNREFGIDASTSMPHFSSLSKLDTDEPIWFIDVEGGGRLELTTEELQDQKRFQRVCMNRLNMMTPVMKNDSWQKLVNDLMDGLTIIEAPGDVSVRGQFYELLESFCTQRAKANLKEEIMRGKPWTEDDGSRHWFRLQDLSKFLDMNSFKYYTRSKITARLKEIGGESKYVNFNRKGSANAWHIPAFTISEEGLLVPKMGNDDEI